MLYYVLRRLFLIFPTMLGIMLMTFLLVQLVPGGPFEAVMASLANSSKGMESKNSVALSKIEGSATTKYRGAQGLSPEFIAKLKEQFGFDKSAPERFVKMVWDYIRFDFGESGFRNIKITSLIKEKMPVSISLGLWMTLISYLISIPLGIHKATRDGSAFDVWTGGLIIVGYAIPGFILAILLIILFAGGSFFDIFPLQGLTSDNFDNLSVIGKIMDYFWHLFLPLVCLSLGAFATMTLLTKNSFLEEINKQYVLTARAKGLTEKHILYRHVFRNAMLIIIASFPAAFVSAFFTGSLLIEVIFSLDGLGRLSFESLVGRDYPVVFALIFIFSLIGLIVNLMSDVIYTFVDPRIDFEQRDV